jgi:Immunoglobulin I-set domain
MLSKPPSSFANPIAMLMAVASVAASLASIAPASAAAAQRIDMKVLLLGTSTTEPDFAAWQGALQREGVPLETIITSPGHAPIAASTLSNTLAGGTQEAKYQAVIVAVGGLPECGESGCVSTLSPSEWSALEEYERTFNVRQLTGDIFPSSAYGLNSPTLSGPLDGTDATLTANGKTISPYLKETVTMDTGTYGYEATPLATQVAGASFDTLVSGPNGSALVGIYTHANGVQEMVQSFNQNRYQLQAELLRHGALNWVTRGVYFGDQRNYYEANIDDNFLADDSWDPAAHATDYNPAHAIREAPTDVEYAANWAQQHNFRIDMLFNGGGSVQYQTEHSGADSLVAAFQKFKGSFGWISHTWDHPNIDVGCASQSYIEAELGENNSWAASMLGLGQSTEPAAALGNDNPSVIVTGEHSGLANLLPGNPGVVDPPDLSGADATEGGTLPAGSYVYAVTDDFAPGGGQSIASVSAPVTVNGSEAVTLTWGAVCHAAEFKIYREMAGSNEWQLIATVPSPSSAPPNSWFANPTTNTDVTGGGALEQTYVDTGAAGTPSSGPPAANEALESPYPQNPSLIGAFQGAGIQFFGSDASKPYPDPTIAGSTTEAYAAGSTFTDGTAQAIPRYPTNIYYNVSTEAQELDEFNQLYTPVAEGGKCVASPVTTCETKPATFAEVVGIVDTNMFQHVMGNDPRPHYFHQPNLMGSPPPGPATTGAPPATSPATGDGLFYSVLNPLLAQYAKYFSAPIEQPTMAQIGAMLAQQQAWRKANAGQVSGYIEGNQVTIQNSGGAVSVPLTGVTGVGSVYGGIQSGWTGVTGATSTRTAQTSWPGAPSVTTNPTTTSPKVTTNPVSKTVTAGESASFTAAASGVPAPTVRWQVSTNGGATFVNDTTDAGNTTGTLTVASTTVALSGRQYRGVFTNATGSATTTAATLTVKAAPPVLSRVSPNSGGALSLVTITGKNFTNVQAVYFGSRAAVGIVLSSTQILVLAPSGTGTVDVTVKTAGGTSATSSADRFTYTRSRF